MEINDDFNDFLEEWTQLKVHSDFYEDGQMEIGINNHTLVDFRSNIIEISVNFTVPKMLSQDILQPELLEVNLI